MDRLIIALIFAGIALLALCIASVTEGRVCVTSEMKFTGCTNGDSLVYTPIYPNTDQLLVFAGRYCNMNKSVVVTKDGVVCLYQTDRNIVNTEPVLEDSQKK